MPLKAYMGYDVQCGSEEGACLIFAHNAREALQLCRPILRSWFSSDFTDVRTRLLVSQEQYLFDTEANQEKLAADIAHVIESPTTCFCCERWGGVLYAFDGEHLCEDCKEDYEADL